jgi:TolB-like protein/DNA-binding winged helix-turn-helix (wHTH) protein/Flp pilus assembly protein TadD
MERHQMGGNASEHESERLTVYRFADITLDPARRSVRRGDKDVRLGRLTYELLLLLVEAAPRVITQEEVAKRLWGDRYASQDTIRQRIKLLRKALSDDADDPRYFGVVRGQGYRLIPEVESMPMEAPSSKRTWSHQRIAGITLAAIAILAVIYWIVPGNGGVADSPDIPAPSTAAPQSIAVLPFENLTHDPEDTYFVEGFHNDLLTQLFKIGSFKVISRTSVSEYRNSDKNLKQIGDELNVATVLEGSVQRSGRKVRINAQLIDAENDEHLWAESYDRELTAQNLFDIQSEMATAVAGALQTVLSPEELARLNQVPTANTKAYNHYLIGIHHLRATDNQVTFPLATQAFQLAVDEDPEFALAWALLSRTLSAVYFFVDKDAATRELALQAVERAFEIQPGLPEAHFAKGYYHYLGFRDYEAALREWDVAEQGMPGDSQIFQARAYVYARMGNPEKALLNIERAVELDPRNIESLNSQAFTYARIHDYEQAERLLDRVVRIAPDRPRGYEAKAALSLWRDGDPDSIRALLDSAPMEVSAPALTWLAAVYERDFENALAQLNEWNFDAIDLPQVYRPKDWFYGMTYKFSGQPDLAERHFRAAKSEIDRLRQEKPNDLRILLTLADILAHLGESQAAIELAYRAMEMLPMSRDAAAAPNVKLYAIKVFLAAADYDAALAELDAFLAHPTLWSIEGLLPDPRLDPIRDDSRFEKLVRKYRRER